MTSNSLDLFEFNTVFRLLSGHGDNMKYNCFGGTNTMSWRLPSQLLHRHNKKYLVVAVGRVSEVGDYSKLR